MSALTLEKRVFRNRLCSEHVRPMLISAAMTMACALSGESPLGGAVLTDGPKAVLSGTVVELGDFPRGKSIVQMFRIENTGTTPLKIAAKANCGCALTDFDRTIPPGGTGKFTVELKSNTLTGDFRKTVDVRTNDSTLPKFVLELKGKTIPAIETSPSMAMRVELNWDGPTEQEYRIKTATGVNLIEAITSESSLNLRLERVETGIYRLIARFAAGTPAGSRSAAVTIVTDAEFEKRIELTIPADKGLVSAPDFLRFAPAFGQAGVAKAAVLVRSASGLVKILKASSTDDSLKVETKPIQEGRIFQVTVTGPVGKLAAKSAAKRSIVLETDNPHQPRFEIPIR